MIATQPASRIFRWPAVIGAASLIGLLSALVGDGAWDALSWTLLALPVGIGLFLPYRGPRKPQETT